MPASPVRSARHSAGERRGARPRTHAAHHARRRPPHPPALDPLHGGTPPPSSIATPAPSRRIRRRFTWLGRRRPDRGRARWSTACAAHVLRRPLTISSTRSGTTRWWKHRTVPRHGHQRTRLAALVADITRRSAGCGPSTVVRLRAVPRLGSACLHGQSARSAGSRRACRRRSSAGGARCRAAPTRCRETV